MTLEIVRENKEKNLKEVWSFMILLQAGRKVDIPLILDDYTAHTIKPKEQYKRYSRLFREYSDITENEVEIPEDVAEEAKREVIKTIKVIKWSEYKK